MNKLIAFITCIILLFGLNGGLSLIKKKRNSGGRRRLSLLMDSFVDPIISDDYFYAVLYVGKPLGQRVEMALDTGSGLPYFACSSTCTHCGKHDDIPYNIENSTSFNWISCKHKLCGGGRCKKFEQQSICEWTQKYVDKSSISAAVGSDLISFYKYPYLPNNISLSFSSLKPLKDEKKLRLIFGCSEQEANTIYRQGADGVMGLSMHHRSFVDQLFNGDNNNIHLGDKQFAHCFGGDTGGILLFGSNEINDLINKFNIKPIWTPFITSNSGHGWYRVKTVGFKVRFNNEIIIKRKEEEEERSNIIINYASNINQGYHGSVIDTGSSTLSMPRRPSQDIMNAILKLVHSQLIKGNKDKFEWTKDITKNYDYFLMFNGKKTFNDNEWNELNEKYIKYFPDIIMLWNGNGNNEALEFIISVKRYLLFKKPHICLDLFGDTPSILVGSNVMVNKFIIYDRENMKLGVADINCDQLLIHSNDNNDNNDKIIITNTEKPENNILPTKSINNKIDENGPVVMIHLANYYDIYLIYFVLLIISTLCVYCLYNKCKGYKSNKNGSNIRYQAINTMDPDLDDNDNENKRHRQHNHRRKRNVQQNTSHSQQSYINVNNDHNMNVNMDILSMTTTTQNFTSKQHQTLQNNNNNNNNDAI